MNNHFEDFPHAADTISAYAFSVDTFIISLKNQEVIQYVTSRPEDFKQWLDEHGIRNVNDSLGKMVHDYYFKQ